MMNRRNFLTSSSSAVLATAVYQAGPLWAQSLPKNTFTVGTRTLDVKGRAATVFGITNQHGASGLNIYQSEGFSARVLNSIDQNTVLHWHGLTPPFELDGSPVSQASIEPGGEYLYQFPLSRSGSQWMHSHHGLQEANLMAAPLIVRPDSDKSADRQDVTILLHDFSFMPPEEIFTGLTGGTISPIGSGMAAMNMGMVRGGDGSMPGMDHSQMNMSASAEMPMDLNDIQFDAYLANDRDLSDPEVVSVESGGRVRLRIINAASSTNFWISLGQLNGSLVAVDGMDVAPVFGRRFEISMAQRLDIDVVIPQGAGAFPILAQREGDRALTGIVLATTGAAIQMISDEAETVAPPVLLDLERQLRASEPLVQRATDRSIMLDLTGDMATYAWSLNGAVYGETEPLSVASGERVEITMRNQTMMSHPMHLHGHHFQITALGSAKISGAMRDTVIVPPRESVTIAFDANNPGEWPLHCHNAYHLEAGMMTTVQYV